MDGMTPGIQEWFAERVPKHWNIGGLEIVADQDEILVVADLPPAHPAHPVPGEDGEINEDLAEFRHFRESSRDERMVLAKAAEKVFGRRVSWGARVGEMVVVFTTASVPVMTRLRLSERQVLDTLIDAGVARSRSEALAWCVRLVGDNEKDWIGELRRTFAHVEAVRDRGPQSRRDRTEPEPN
jgi:hypothetical protein